MRRTTLTQLLTTTPAPRSRSSHSRSSARRAAARLALTLGVMSSCVGLGLLAGEFGRALIGG